MAAVGQPARASEPKRVLLLNSYHPGYQWTDDETRGVLAEIGGSPKDIQVNIEYMGTKWANSPAYFEQLRQAYATKFQKVPFDAIVATDDDAFRFLLQYRDAIFGRVPTVFCGVNNFDPRQLAGHDLYTGVNEVADFRGGLDLVLRLHPATRRVTVISDSSISGRKIRAQFEEVVPEYASRLAFEFLGEGPVEAVLDRISHLPPDALVFHLVYFSDYKGRIIDNDETAALVSRASSVPVYGGWEFSLGRGIVGGKLLRGYDQGLAAGQMVHRVLGGASVADLPVRMTSPTQFMFDDRQLRRFGIRRANLPAESIIINAPPSFYALNKSLVWIGVGVLAGLAAAVILLLRNKARRRRAEEALAVAHQQATRSRDNLHQLLESIPDMVVMSRLDGSVVFVNGKGRQTLRIVTGSPISAAAVLPDEQSILRRTLEAASVGRQPAIATVHVSIVPGTRECEITSLRVDLQGQPAIVTVLRDVTERREIERRLALSDRMASLGTLAAGVAHEVNNPLSSVLSNLRFIAGELAGSETTSRETLSELRAVADDAIGGAERVRKIVLDLNAFARQSEDWGPVDLHRVLDTATNLARSQIESRATLVKDYGQVPTIHGNESRLCQVALNLLVNAVQAFPDGRHPGQNEIHLVTRTDPSGRAVFQVRDNGSGIPPESLSRVFEPFFTTRPVGAGTGLGLSICHALVSSLKGEITVHSEVGQGTVFSVLFPAA
jgi:PAS domain S-box-containing protein